jgi:urease accessory protein
MESGPLRLVDVQTRDTPLASNVAARSLILTCEQRAKTRFRARLSDGRDAVVMLARGTVMRPGTQLVAENGEVVDVVAASEQVYRVTANPDSHDPAFDLLRAAYHLGNRHVPVELGPDFLKLERDPVLRDLLRRLRMIVEPAFESFDPEPGAYGGGHRHDTDTEGGAVGEALSRDAHAMR